MKNTHGCLNTEHTAPPTHDLFVCLTHVKHEGFSQPSKLSAFISSPSQSIEYIHSELLFKNSSMHEVVDIKENVLLGQCAKAGPEHLKKTANIEEAGIDYCRQTVG